MTLRPKQVAGIRIASIALDSTCTAKAGRLIAIEGGNEQCPGVIVFHQVFCFLVLTAELERMFAPYPKQGILQRVIVVIILEVPGIQSAPSAGRVGSRKTCFEKGIAR